MKSVKLASVAAALLLASTAVHADVSISSKPTQNMSCDAGVCTATANNAVLNVSELQTMLASGDTAVQTGTMTNDIKIVQPLSWTSASRLTLHSCHSVLVEKPVNVLGSGAVSIILSDGLAGGELVTEGKGNVQFWDIGSNVVINGLTYSLVGNLYDLSEAILQNPNGNFALAASYDAGNDGTYNAAPIWGHFGGKLEGFGHTISHLAIKDFQTNDNVGLFSTIDGGGFIENLSLSHVSILAETSNNTGGIAGTADALQNVHVTGKIHGWGTVGGLAGSAGTVERSDCNCTVLGGAFSVGGLAGSAETIENSYANATVKGGYFVGGLAGGASVIRNSHASGVVTGDFGVGGLLGTLFYTTVERSYSSSTVKAATTNAAIGGLVGTIQNGTIAYSFATGAVVSGGGSSSYAGGLAGMVCACQVPIYIKNSYASGSVRGNDGTATGGFIGFVQAGSGVVVSSAYATGAVAGTGPVGGFVGFDGGGNNFANTYWDLDTSGVSDPSKGVGNIPNDPGITGLSDTQLRSGLPKGFDPKHWSSDPNINNGYPYLLANPPPKGQ